MKETEKQLSFIKLIEHETGIKYNGNTKQEASIYISENKDKLHFDTFENEWAIINGY